MRFNKYIKKERETIMAFKLTHETFNELFDDLVRDRIPFTMGYNFDDPCIELPVCGGGKETATLGDYIALFGSCFCIYKQAWFEDSFVEADYE